MNQITSTAGVTYSYDGDGRRVEKSGGTIYWYGTDDDALDETDLSGNLKNEYVFFGGKRIARRDSSGNIFYYFADHLGTSREIVQAGQSSPCYDADFFPFGGERTPIVNSCSTSQNYKFTGKERDSESGLDDFGARYYASQFGRFMSPDWSAAPAPVPYVNLTNPQTLNLYAMVSDNPETFADLDGHCCSEELKFFGQELVGVGKQAVNTVTSTINLASSMQGGIYVPGGGTNIPQLQSSNLGQTTGMVIGGVATAFIPVAGEEEAAAGGATILENSAKGAASESRILNQLGQAKNTEAVVGTEGNSIPDFQNSTTVGEIKDAKTVSNTPQLRIQKEAAQDSGRQHELHTGINTHVTKPAAEGTNVMRHVDLGPKKPQ